MTPEQEDNLLQTVARIELAIIGNGVKGLAQRMEEAEAWQTTHPRVCPMERHVEDTVDSPKERRAGGWSVFGMVSGFVFGVGGLAFGLIALLMKRRG